MLKDVLLNLVYSYIVQTPLSLTYEILIVILVKIHSIILFIDTLKRLTKKK